MEAKTGRPDTQATFVLNMVIEFRVLSLNIYIVYIFGNLVS